MIQLLTNTMASRTLNSLCVYCLQGYTWECRSGCSDKVTDVTPVDEDKKERGGQIKDRASVKDLESTGRKRAAEMYPIKVGMPCEWSGLKFAGGGVIPIIGCSGGVATNRHHGPDKNTLNNEMGNVHRICSTCHNRYHAANDKYYVGERPPGDSPWLPVGDLIPHDSVTKATPEEIIESELKWRTNQ